MDSGCVYSQLNRITFSHCKGRDFDILKHSTQQGLSLLDSLKKTCNFKLRLRNSSQHSTHHVQALVVNCNHPQNADFPRYHSKKEKKPFPIPIVELRRAARERFKKSKSQPRGPVPPPKRGLVVQRLVPLAYSVFNARITLINNLKKLLKVVPVNSCKL